MPRKTGSRLGILVLSLLTLAGVILGIIGAFLAMTWLLLVGLVGAALLGLLVIPWVLVRRRHRPSV